MKFSLLNVAATVALILTAFVQIYAEAPAGLDDDPVITKTFDLSSGELFVSTSGGSIQVKGSNSSQVKVEMYAKSMKHSDAKIREILDEDYKIRIEKNGARIEAVAERIGSGWSWNGISISFVVYTPSAFNCELITSGGSLNLSGVKAKNHEMKTSGGSITAIDIAGELLARTSGGSITVNDMQGRLDANTSGGSIKLEDITGDIDANTSGGGINIIDVKGEVNASTSGGSIKADISRLEKQLVLKTSGGSVNVTIPSGMGLDLDLRGNRVNTSLNNFSGESKSDRVKGTINGGGVLVQLSTSGGGVNLNFR
ncbi:MAG: DUF4097 domain-containing protein [Cyclobacteriaceae bacterium]|nr:DUF4097 domain-containing protein [Cyclobacteriaceae bacterium]